MAIDRPPRKTSMPCTRCLVRAMIAPRPTSSMEVVSIASSAARSRPKVPAMLCSVVVAASWADANCTLSSLASHTKLGESKRASRCATNACTGSPPTTPPGGAVEGASLRSDELHATRTRRAALARTRDVRWVMAWAVRFPLLRPRVQPDEGAPSGLFRRDGGRFDEKQRGWIATPRGVGSTRGYVARLRISPSCVVEATSLPSCVNTRPRASPRAPWAAGLSST